MDSLLSKKEKIAALFILSAISIFVIYLVGIALEKNLFSKIALYHTIVKDGEGLRPGVEISFLGVKIGEVGSISILEDNTLRVTLEIYDSYTDWISDKSRLIIERRYGIGEKKVKLVNDHKGVPIDPGGYIASTEKLDIVELFYRIDFVQLAQTLEKTVFIAGKFIEQIEKEGRIEHVGEVIDNISNLLENIHYIVSEGKSPFLNLLNDPNLRQSFASLNNFLNNDDLRIILDETAKLTKDHKVFHSIENLQKNFGSTEFSNAIRGANAFFNNPDLYAVIKEGKKLAKDGELTATIEKVSQIVSKLDRMLPQLNEKGNDFTTTLKELDFVLKRLQQTWFMDEKTREAFVQLVVVLKAMQRTWLLEDEAKAVLEEQALEKGK